MDEAKTHVDKWVTDIAVSVIFAQHGLGFHIFALGNEPSRTFGAEPTHTHTHKITRSAKHGKVQRQVDEKRTHQISVHCKNDGKAWSKDGILHDHELPSIRKVPNVVHCGYGKRRVG